MKAGLNSTHVITKNVLHWKIPQLKAKDPYMWNL